jgi:uncharacterized protein YjbI with pentapeptide repeats
MSHYGGMLTAENDYDGEVLTGDLSGQSAEHARFLECTFQRCDLSEVRAPRARFADTGMYAVHGAGVDLAETSWLDCVVQGARLGAVALYGAELRRVRFEGCKIEFLNLRGASLAQVSFIDCQLLEPDFTEAQLDGVDFSGSRLVAADFARSRMKAVDLSGAEVSAPRGLAGLRGATISRLQLIDLGPSFAAELGIVVAD